jgi:hypothetical protein
MVETITTTRADSVIEALHQLATVVLGEHINEQGLCVVCGSAWPCERVILADHNFEIE